MKFLVAIVKKNQLKYKKDSIGFWPSFTSTSSDLTAAKKFVRQQPESGVIFIIKLFKYF